MHDRVALLQIGTLTPRMRARLRPRFEILPLFEAPDRAGFLAEHGPRIAALATDGHWGVPADVAAACPNLRVVASKGVGYDAIDTPAMLRRGVLVSYTPDVLNAEVATTAILLWLAVARNLIALDHWARSGRWEREGAAPLTRAAHGRRVGILGLGRIGETIALRARAFDAEIHYHARSPKPVPYIYHDSPVALARAVEVLIVITPGGAGTRHLVGAAALEALGRDGIVVNVGRGSVVDEAALIAALAAGAIAGAGLDVFENEPHIPEALKAMQSVVLLPHVGSATRETREAMGDLVCDNLLRWAEDGTVLTPVPESEGVA